MNRRDGIILQKVLSEVNIAAGMMKGCSLTEFLDNEMLKRAVCMTVINVGELVKNLTEECRLSHPGGSVERNRRVPGYCCTQVSDTAHGRRLRNGRDGLPGFAEKDRQDFS